MGRTILIADDSSVERLLLAAILKKQYEVISAADGEQALALLPESSERLCAVILDIMMPGRDGLEILKIIRADAKYQSIPVIITTGLEDESVRERAVALGANSFITKPYSPSLLLNSVNNAIKLRETSAMLSTLRHDKLTGLLGREAFFAEAEQLLSSHPSGYYVLSCFDIEKFKIVNDQYGTQAGDEVLRHVAASISSFVSGYAGLTCRFAADRFAILYPATLLGSAELEQNHRLTTSPPAIGREIRIRIGRFLATDLSLSVSAMYDRATLAQESIKGRYDVYIADFDDAMREELLEEQRIVNEMQSALKNGEFEPWLQPQYNHATGALIGSEALVRWRRGGELIPPDRFIPIFERNGFIYEMDKFVWESVCRMLRRWLDEGRSPLPVSVNISRRDMLMDGFVSALTGFAHKYSLPFDLLRLEVTESALTETEIISRVSELISLGFTVEIDDFGSGYSSLNTLKDVPASVLKLDMRFFENTSDARRGGNIVESVVRMAKWLGMSVIAEGVEDGAQADFLRSIGCCYIQGFFYARPMPVCDFEALMSGRQEPKLARIKTLGSLDNNDFWDPRSIETLIFNSYVGGACIFEYHGGEAELLRVNEQYPRELGELVPEGGRMSEGDHIRFLDEDNKHILFNNIREAIATGRQASCELRLSDPQTGRTEYIRSTQRVIAHTEERWLLYCVILNMTVQREAERREIESAHRLRAVMSNINGSVCAITLRESGEAVLIFGSDNYFALFGYTHAQAAGMDVMSPILPQDRAAVTGKLLELKREKKPVIIDYRANTRDGRVINIRSNSSLMSLEGWGEEVIVSVATDVTAEREASDQLRFLNESAHDILAQPDTGAAINRTLEKLRQYFAGDRAYVFEFEGDTGLSHNTYERCGPGVSSELERLKDLPISVTDYWAEALARDEYVVIPDVAQIGDEHAALRELLAVQDIRSLFVAPLSRDGALVGYIGIDNPTRAQDQLSRLRALGDYIAVLLTRRDLSAKIESDQKMMAALMDGTPGGFVRMKLGKNGAFTPVYSNDGLAALFGMTHEQLHEIYGQDVLAGVHPEDREAVRAAGERMLAGSLSETARFRVKNAEGEYIWLSLNGRMTQDAAGGVFLNVYYADATREIEQENERERTMRQQKELLDNLPCGAALYRFSGGALSAVHINRRYWELVQREPGDHAEAAVLEAIYPDDRATLRAEVQSAIRQKRNAEADLRIRLGSGGYRPFRITASQAPQRDGSVLFFAAYSPISEQTMSFQEMLPIALSTMMSASEDISYIKDSELHYICCSASYAQLLGQADHASMVGKTDAELFDPAAARGYMESDRQLILSGQSVINKNEQLTAADGSVILVSTSKYPLTDASGCVVGLYGVSRDITAQRRNESQLELLTSSIPGGIAAYTITDEGIKMLYFNDGFYSFCGYDREEYARRVESEPLFFVLEEDRPRIREMIAGFKDHRQEGHVNGCEYRCHTREGGYCWMSMKSVLSRLGDDQFVVNVVQLDITEQQEEKERLRISEEFNRIAIEQSGSIITRFDVASRTLTLPDSFNPIFVLPQVLYNMPQEQIDLGRVSPDTAAEYTELFEGIIRGKAAGRTTYKQNSQKGWRWLEAQFTTVFSDAGAPVSAVISFTDVTEQLEKEVVYNKWQQSLSERPKDSYTLFRCNLSKAASFDSREGTLLSVNFCDDGSSFDERTAQYAAQCVCPEDRARYIAFLSSGRLLANYYRGRRGGSIEYREKEGLRWLRLSVDLVEYPSSHDVEAYLMYEDIDEQKKADLLTLERSETDPLTGILNRAAFIAKMEDILDAAEPEETHALMMLDVDNFKRINDTLGHGAGDRVLLELTQRIGAMLRRADFMGRLGGDEFFVFLRDVGGDAAAAAKAEKICALRMTTGGETVTTSIGIAMIPRDGISFDELYKKVDGALYRQKERGKDGYLFVSGEN